METTTILLLLIGLFSKHLIVDFPMQVPYHYLNKGTYGHPGGIQHSMFHGIGTALVVFLVMFSESPTSLLETSSHIVATAVMFAAAIGFVDFLIHYHVDWAKMNLNKKLGWGPTTHEEFWWLLGLDQYVHALTYLGIAWYLA